MRCAKILSRQSAYPAASPGSAVTTAMTVQRILMEQLLEIGEEAHKVQAVLRMQRRRILVKVNGCVRRAQSSSHAT